jgi:hypothetical protein
VIPLPSSAAGGSIDRLKDDEIQWTIVNDPDGVAVCVFGPHPADPSLLGPFELVVDAVDPPAIAAWWAERTGGTVGTREGAPFVWIEGAEGFPYMFWIFHDVPEPKTVKNRGALGRHAGRHDDRGSPRCRRPAVGTEGRWTALDRDG